MLLEIILAALISIILGSVGYVFGVVNVRGFISGVVLSVGILLCFIYGYQNTEIGIKWFLLLVGFVVIGGISTRYKYGVKDKLHVAEKAGGRGVGNVMGNGFSALLCALLFAFTQQYMFLIGYVCAIAAATSDTVAAEIGQLAKKKPIMITTFKKVEVGTDGGITPLGEISALAAAVLIAAIPLALGIGDAKMLLVASAAGFIACNIDSLFGATLERRGIFNKHFTNLFATLSGAVIGILIFMHV